MDGAVLVASRPCRKCTSPNEFGESVCFPSNCIADCAYVPLAVFLLCAFFERHSPTECVARGLRFWNVDDLLGRLGVWFIDVEPEPQPQCYRSRSSGERVSSSRVDVCGVQNVRIFVSSSNIACSESVSILSASEGMSVVASSAESGVSVPANVSLHCTTSATCMSHTQQRLLDRCELWMCVEHGVDGV